MRPLIFSGSPLYSAAFWSAYYLWLVLEFVWSRTRRSQKKPLSSPKDRGSFLLIVISMWVALGLAFALAFLLPKATIEWHRSFIFWTGIALMLAGLGFRYYAIRTLGGFFTFDVAVHSGQTVVERGPYRYIRHPSYTGGLITLTGVGVSLGNWAGLAALLAVMVTAYGYRIHVEESALLTSLGASYQSYRSRTKRIIPFVI